jgi:holliday junction DNA helicase RuvA
MIAYLEGKLTYKDATYVILDIGGIGYQVKISLTTYSIIKSLEKCKLHTYQHITENAHILFGFHDEAEKKVFMELISISGVGPNTGLMILSSLAPEELQQAIVNEDVRTIQSIKGIGAKTAQRIILELKDKMKKDGLITKTTNISDQVHNTVKIEALTALMTLGFNKAAAEKSIDIIVKNTKEPLSLENVIKLALKSAH